MTLLSMNVRVHETDRPIAGLVVTWYAIEDDVLPSALSKVPKWDRARLRPLNEYGLTVLGSATTDANGTARLELDEALTSQVANVWYTVKSGDIAGTQRCAQTIHVACDLRRLAVNHERFAVRIPRTLLDRVGYGRRASPAIDTLRGTDEFDSALEAVEVAPKRKPENAPVFTKAIEKRIRQAQRQLSKAPRNQTGRLPITMLQVRSATGKGMPAIAFDEAVGSLSVRNPATQVDVALSFGGVARYSSPGLTESQIERPHVVVDETTGRTDLVLPVVPDDLVAREQAPSKLYRRLTLQGK